MELISGLTFFETYNGFGWETGFPYPLFIFGMIGIVEVAKVIQILVRKSKKQKQSNAVL